MTPRVSFVIPAYNTQAWIAETLLSCLNQSVKQLEVVVVNDGSTDHTKEIIDCLASDDNRIVPVHLEQNVGRSEARNIGNRKAQSDIILVLDSDDLSTRNRVKDTLACFEKQKPDLIYGGSISMDSFGNVERQFIPEPFNKERSLKHKTHFICHSTVAYRKNLTLNVQYSSGEFARLGIDDWKFIWDVHRKGYKFGYVKAPLAYHRVYQESITFTRNPTEVAKVKDEYVATF